MLVIKKAPNYFIDTAEGLLAGRDSVVVPGSAMFNSASKERQ